MTRPQIWAFALLLILFLCAFTDADTSYAFFSVLAQCCLIVPADAQEVPAPPKPTYPVAAHAPMFQLQGHPPAIELTGVDLMQGNAPIRGKIPNIEAGKPL